MAKPFKAPQETSDEDSSFLSSLFPEFGGEQQQAQPQQQEPTQQQQDDDAQFIQELFPDLAPPQQQPDISGISFDEPLREGETTRQYVERFSKDRKPEGVLAKTGRIAAGMVESVGSILGGLPGSLLRLPGSLAESIAEKIGFPLRDPEKFDPATFRIPKEKHAEVARLIKQYKKDQPPGIPGLIESPLDIGLPTVSGVKKGIAESSEAVFGTAPGYFEPKTPGEKNAREYVEDVTSYLHPMLGPIGAVRAVLTPLLGLGGKLATKALGGKEWMQGLVKGGLEFGSLLLRPGKLLSYMDKKFSQVDNALKPSIVHDAKGIKDYISKERRIIDRIDDPTRADKWLQARFNGITKNIHEGEMSVRTAWEMKKKLSQHAFDFTGGDPRKMGYIKTSLKGMNDELNNFIVSYFKKYNPKMTSAYKEANDIYSGINNMSSIVENIRSAYDKKTTYMGAALIFGKAGLATVIGAAALGKGIKTAAEAANAFWNSKAIRVFYRNGMIAAAKNKTKTMIKNFDKMQASLEKEFPGSNERLKEMMQNEKT